MISIYHLIDPRDDKPFYVGQSANPDQRLAGHKNSRKTVHKHNAGLTPTQIRLCEIYDADLKPSLKIVETGLSFAEARESEHKWVLRLTAQGYKLTNKLAVIGNLGEAKQHTKINDMIAEMGYMATIEAAHYLKLTPTRVRMLVCEGKIHIRKLGGMNLYSFEELKNYHKNKGAGGRRKSS